MKTLGKLTLAQRFFALIAVFVLGFCAYGAWSLKTLSELQVNGPVYRHIVQGKDLIADVLPPPAYVLEAYLTALQLTQAASADEKREHIAKLQKLKNDYDLRHEFWVQESLESELADVFLKQSHAPAKAFFQVGFDELVPAVLARDERASSASLARMKDAYLEHRRAIDRVVQIAEKRNQATEAMARERTIAAFEILLAVLVVCMAAGIGFAALVVRSLMQSLGAEPAQLGEASRKIAGGDLEFEFNMRPGDQHSVLYQIYRMQQQLSVRMALEKAQQQSDLRATRAEAELRIAEEKSQADREKQEIYESMVQATQHVLNNLLNQLQLFKLIADNSKDFDPDILSLYDSVTEEASALIAKLSRVTQPTSHNIREAVAPVPNSEK